LFGAKASSSIGLNNAIVSFLGSLSLYVPEVPSGIKEGTNPSKNPSFTLSIKSVNIEGHLKPP